MAFEIKAAGLLVIAIFIGSTLGLMMTTQPVYAPGTQPHCGDTLTGSVKLTGPLDCNPTSTSDYGLFIGTKLTLDCAGYEIRDMGITTGYAGIWVGNAKGVHVKNCVVSGWQYGFLVRTVESSRFTGNVVGYKRPGNSHGNTYGFSVSYTTKTTFSGNNASYNIYDGFAVGSTASGNTLSRNVADSNGGLGFTDGSSGSGTAGTANTYRGNTCDGENNSGSPQQSSPDGLCSVPTS
jgi:parallel beta-helix repeat protein